MLLPDGAATSDMSHNYQPEHTLGLQHQGLLAQEAIGHPGFAALTMRRRPPFDRPSQHAKLEYRRDRI
jgi:hypothetical protein